MSYDTGECNASGVWSAMDIGADSGVAADATAEVVDAVDAAGHEAEVLVVSGGDVCNASTLSFDVSLALGEVSTAFVVVSDPASDDPVGPGVVADDP